LLHVKIPSYRNRPDSGRSREEKEGSVRGVCLVGLMGGDIHPAGSAVSTRSWVRLFFISSITSQQHHHYLSSTTRPACWVHAKFGSLNACYSV